MKIDGDVTIVEQAKVFDCADGEDSLKVTTSPQSLQTVKVDEKEKYGQHNMLTAIN